MDISTPAARTQKTGGASDEQARIDAFVAKFPSASLGPSEVLLPLTWAQLARQLRDLSHATDERICWDLEGLRRASRNVPPELFLRDLIALSYSLLDEVGPDIEDDDPSR